MPISTNPQPRRITQSIAELLEQQKEYALSEYHKLVAEVDAGGPVSPERIADVLRRAEILPAAMDADLSRAQRRRECLADIAASEALADERAQLEELETEITARFREELAPVETRLAEIAQVDAKADDARRALEQSLDRNVKRAINGVESKIQKLRRVLESRVGPTDEERQFVETSAYFDGQRRIYEGFRPRYSSDQKGMAACDAIAQRERELEERKESAVVEIERLERCKSRLMQLAVVAAPSPQQIADALGDDESTENEI